MGLDKAFPYQLAMAENLSEWVKNEVEPALDQQLFVEDVRAFFIT